MYKEAWICRREYMGVGGGMGMLEEVWGCWRNYGYVERSMDM